MPELTTFTLGGEEYPLDGFTVGEVQRLLPLLSNAGISTVPGMSAIATVVHIGVSKRRPDMTFDQFQAIPNVTITELQRAFQVIGLKIGYFALKKSDDGAAAEARNGENPAPDEGENTSLEGKSDGS